MQQNNYSQAGQAASYYNVGNQPPSRSQPPQPPQQQYYNQPPPQQTGGYSYNQQQPQQQQPYQQQYGYQQYQPQQQSIPQGYQPQGYQQGYQQQGYQGQSYPQQQQPQPHQQPTQQPNQLNAAYIQSILSHTIKDQNLSSFYPENSLPIISNKISSSGVLGSIKSAWKISDDELVYDLVKLALFDIILYIDDSGSMMFEENGERINFLKTILSKVTFASSLFDNDGISIRFMNSDFKADGVNSETKALDILNHIKFAGITPLGTSLFNKVVNPLALQPARAGSLRKPLLIITITDGQPVGEDRHTTARVIKDAKRVMQQTRYGPDALSFQFAQVGNDLMAQKFLHELDTDPEVGSFVDCTSNYELEAYEMQQKTGKELLPEMWVIKMLLGAIDSKHDGQDER